MNQHLHRYASTRNILFLAFLWIVFNVAFSLVFAPLEGVVPDLKLYYTATQIYHTISQYDAHHIQTYINGTLLLDFLYPWIYGLLLSFLLFRLSSNIRLSLLPVLIMFFDYLENILVLIVMYTYPRHLDAVATSAGLFTMLKWLSTALCLGVIMYLFFMYLGKRYLTEKRNF